MGARKKGKKMSKVTCAERISESIKNAEEELKDIFSRIDGEMVSEDTSETQSKENAYSDFHNYALGSSTTMLTTITLSWGGPASYLEVEHEPKGEIESITYRFSDWFDTATERITDTDSPLWRYAESVLESLTQDL